MDTNSLLVGVVAGVAIGALIVIVYPHLLARAGYSKNVNTGEPTPLYAVEDSEVGEVEGAGY